jgi:hypothetical protein
MMMGIASSKSKTLLETTGTTVGVGVNSKLLVVWIVVLARTPSSYSHSLRLRPSAHSLASTSTTAKQAQALYRWLPSSVGNNKSSPLSPPPASSKKYSRRLLVLSALFDRGDKGVSQEDAPDSLLKSENDLLRDKIRQLEQENEQLKQKGEANKIVILETFEGEGRQLRSSTGTRTDNSTFFERPSGITTTTLTGEELGVEQKVVDAALWCDELEDGE